MSSKAGPETTSGPCLFRPHARIAARTARGRNDRHVAAASDGAGARILGSSLGRRADHAFGAGELVARRLVLPGCAALVFDRVAALQAVPVAAGFRVELRRLLLAGHTRLGSLGPRGDDEKAMRRKPQG